LTYRSALNALAVTTERIFTEPVELTTGLSFSSYMALVVIVFLFNGSVVLSALNDAQLTEIDELESARFVHRIAGLAIVTVEGWAACSGNR
jgi:hypothetical protein